MKQILLITLFSFAFSSFMIASTDKFTDKMAVIGSPGLSSDPCAVIDKKLIRLDEFTTMVNNTSAFHLEEKAEALSVPGITVSNNKKKMLRDAKKKYAEYSSERQKYTCDTPMTVNKDKETVVSKPALSSDPSAVINEKPVKQDKVTTKVNHTSAVHAEEKDAALRVPEITQNNKKEPMLKVEEKKAEAIEVEHPKYVAETPTPVSTDKTVEKKAVVSKSTLSSDLSAAIDKKPVKQDKVTNNASTDTFTDKIAVIGSPGLSSDPCAAIDKKLMKLYEFMMMVNNTSAFHLEEKAEALSVPGISVSNNKKKMLRDAKKKYTEYSAERQKYGCEPIEIK